MAVCDVGAYRDHLRHSAVLPFAWTPRDPSESSLVLARRHRRNVAALALDSAGDERRPERSADEPALAPELARIETKLNVVMELFASIVERDVVLPPPTQVRFNAWGVEWNDDDAPAAGRSILIRLHLETFPALPLELAATTLSGTDIKWGLAVFDALRAPLPEAIEKHVFREHRRQVADSIEVGK
jgi:pimeloyl-ACP methyl ester carboxylesterase